MTPSIEYKINVPLDAMAVSALFKSSGIRRPVDDLARLARMFEEANLVVSAWVGEELVGVGRALTDYAYCCYLSDLAVAKPYQQQGIGQAIVKKIRQELGDEVSLILIAAPEAASYYELLGFEPLQNGFVLKRSR